MKNYNSLKNRLLKDKEIKQAYEELEPEFKLVVQTCVELTRLNQYQRLSV